MTKLYIVNEAIIFIWLEYLYKINIFIIIAVVHSYWNTKYYPTINSRSDIALSNLNMSIVHYWIVRQRSFWSQSNSSDMITDNGDPVSRIVNNIRLINIDRRGRRLCIDCVSIIPKSAAATFHIDKSDSFRIAVKQ